MEDALEPSLGASNSVVATPEKAWLQRLNQLKKEVCGQSFCFFMGFAALLTPVFFDDSMTVSFFSSKVKQKRKALAMRLCMGFNCYVLLGFSNLDLWR
jgi:hypothetical protein